LVPDQSGFLESRRVRLKDQVALITGANSGIGRALAKGLAGEGARIVVNYPPWIPSADDVVQEITGVGSEAVAVQADVRELSEHARLISTALEHFGRLDILINNAGVEFREPFLSTDPGIWDATMEVNLKAPYFLSQAAAQAMIRSGGTPATSGIPANAGKIINLSSVHDTVPLLNRSVYAISKGGIGMLTKALALELAEHGINVNAIAPGAILTDMNRESLSIPENRATLLERIPCKRIGDVQDLVGAAVFLASSESDYVTGATIYVDGGLLLRRI
jgi:glucose 1-dehydrogenase